MRAINPVQTRTARSLALALGLLSAAGLHAADETLMAPEPGAPAAAAGPSAQEMSEIQEQKWMIRQRIELARLQAELFEAESRIRPPADEEASREEASDGDQDTQEAMAAEADPNPERTWVMTQYSRYGDHASARVASRFGELTVRSGDQLGAWTVSDVGAEGVSVRNERLGERRIPFSDQWAPGPELFEADGGSAGVGFPGMN